MPENEVLAQALGLSEPAARKFSERNVLRNVIKHLFFLDVIVMEEIMNVTTLELFNSKVLKGGFW